MAAEEAYVLSPTDVRNIRSYVQHKYAAMPHETRAEIVADAVNRIIHKQLPDFEESIKRSITATLIRTTVLEYQRPVRSDDIFEVCLTLDRSEAQIGDPLHNWVEKQLRISCDKPLLQRLLDKLPTESMTTTDRDYSLWLKLRGLLKDEQIIEGAASSISKSSNVVVLPLSPTMPLKQRLQARTLMYSLLCAILIMASLLYGWSMNKGVENKLEPLVEDSPIVPIIAPVDGLPNELRYQQINEARLITYLETKSSILAKQPYFEAIMTAAQSFDIHPIILFAITGQEQAFVPTSNKLAKEIANNPFNVFHSWKDYNTSIHDSADIAARTVFNLSKDRPDGVDPFTWINRKYAEDPKWSNGVRSIFNTIVAFVDTPASK